MVTVNEKFHTTIRRQIQQLLSESAYMDFWLVLGLLQTQHVSQTLHTLLDHSIAAGREAGDTYSKLAEVHVKQDGKADAAQAYVEASKAYQRVDKSSMQAFPSCSSLLTHQCQCMEACLALEH